MNNNLQTGFTLIELMNVIAIIGILSSIALPTYQDFTIRARISEAFLATSAAKTHVSEYYIGVGKMPADISNTGIESTSTLVISGIEYTQTDDNNAIIATKLKAMGAISLNDSYKLIGTGDATGVSWTCAANTVPTRYLPAVCRW